MTDHSSSNHSDHETSPADKPFPVHYLPVNLRRAVNAITDVIPMPAAIPACVAIGATSAAIGNGLRIRSTAQGDTSGANVFILAAAQSSSGKSLAYKHLFRPFREFEAGLRGDYRKFSKPKVEHERKMIAAEQRKIQKLIEGKGASEEDRQRHQELENELAKLNRISEPRLFVENITPQKLVRVMSQQPSECLTSASPDARESIKVLLGKHNGGQADDAFYISAWSRETYAFDRVSSEGESIVLESPCLNLLWLVQPDRLRELAAETEVFESGFYQRLLVSNQGGEAVMPSKNPIDQAALDMWQETQEELLNCYRISEEASLVLPSPEAFDALWEFQEEAVRLQNEQYRDLPTVTGKWGENAWRLALIFHAIKHGRKAAGTRLRLDTAQEAIMVMDWFSQQSLALLRPGREARKHERANQLRQVLHTYFDEDGAMVGVLRRNHGFEVHELQAIAQSHKAQFILEPIKPDGAGRPSLRLRLRPRSSASERV